MTAAIILAAGRGERMGAAVDKAFLSLGQKPVVAYSLLAFESCSDIDAIVLVVRKERMTAAQEMAKMFGISKLLKVVSGGDRRQDSVKAGLAALPPEVKIVSIHDAARPLVTPALISLTVKSAKETGSGVAAHKVVDTIKKVNADGVVTGTVDREKLWAVETPQTFNADLIRNAYAATARKRCAITDDASALELAGEPVSLVEWKKPNIKITFVDDLQTVSSILHI